MNWSVVKVTSYYRRIFETKPGLISAKASISKNGGSNRTRNEWVHELPKAGAIRHPWSLNWSSYKYLNNIKNWSVGRVARHRSAKPGTAVRIRHRPHKNPFWNFVSGGFFISGLSQARLNEGRKQKRPESWGTKDLQGIFMKGPSYSGSQSNPPFILNKAFTKFLWIMFWGAYWGADYHRILHINSDNTSINS